MKNPIILCFSVFTLLLVSSCGISNSVTSSNILQKRKYSKGWNLNLTKVKKNSNTTLDNTVDSYEAFSKKYSKLKNESTESTDVYTSLDKQEKDGIKDLVCDTIRLTTGEIIPAEIVNTTSNTVRYQKCESSDTTQFILNKNEVSILKYANGDFERINPISQKNNDSNNENSKSARKIGGIFLLLFLLFILLILILIFYIISNFWEIFF